MTARKGLVTTLTTRDRNPCFPDVVVLIGAVVTDIGVLLLVGLAMVDIVAVFELMILAIFILTTLLSLESSFKINGFVMN